jgi:hypothetical protein
LPETAVQYVTADKRSNREQHAMQKEELLWDCMVLLIMVCSDFLTLSAAAVVERIVKKGVKVVYWESNNCRTLNTNRYT